MTFCGIKMSQSWNDLQIWEEFFNECPIKTLIELGTDNGGMSLFFAMQCRQRGVEFHTFDHQAWVDFGSGLPALFDLKKSFHNVDLFHDIGEATMSNLLATCQHPIAIFFDNGDKPREWARFAHLTPPGDFCIVHDWEVEFSETNIGDVPVERIFSSEARPSMQTVWFKRI